MKRMIAIALLAAMVLSLAACGSSQSAESELYVEKIEGLSKDFVMGMDVSSVLSLEASGVKYYDFEGNEADPLKVLADSGVNYIRVRVWNDPYDENGNGYGGGNCDLQTAIELGKRAAKYGMSLLVDFHYSDFWADPAKQQAPKAWADMTTDEKAEAIYDWTVESLKAMKSAGVKVGMVQVGNETTGGFCGETSVPKVTKLMASAAKAIRDVDKKIQIVVHYTNPESKNYKNIAAQLDVNGVDYDIFATSYYPYWHGTLENLTSNLQSVVDNYGKKVMIAEISWAYTVENTDMHGNTIGEELSYDKPYPFTVQGQATAVAEAIRTLAAMGDSAVGLFYWEGAWISVPGDTWEEQSALWEQHGSGWASSYAAEYDPNDAGVYYGGCACDNQAMFDATGHPLESLNVFRYVYTGTTAEVKVDTVESVYVTVKLNNTITLPETVDAIFNNGETAPVSVEWDAGIDLDAISASPVGTYPVTGTADGMSVTCYINMVEENYAENYSFEDDDYSMWNVNEISASGITDFQVKTTDAYSGSVSLHFYNTGDVEFTVEQEITGLREGSYCFSIQAQGGDVGDAEMYIYVVADGVTYTESFLVTSWREFQNPKIEGISVASGNVTIGVYIKTAAGGWGTLDDFLFNPEN